MDDNKKKQNKSAIPAEKIKMEPTETEAVEIAPAEPVPVEPPKRIAAVIDSPNGLNLRTRPVVDTSTVKRVAKNGETFDIVNDTKEWLEIKDNTDGKRAFCMKKFVEVKNATN